VEAGGVRSDGVLHGVDVDAESLYEAVAIAVAQFREDDISPRECQIVDEKALETRLERFLR
jgi:hypothetical protein